jgi:hypothetical protein
LLLKIEEEPLWFSKENGLPAHSFRYRSSSIYKYNIHPAIVDIAPLKLLS